MIQMNEYNDEQRGLITSSSRMKFLPNTAARNKNFHGKYKIMRLEHTFFQALNA